VVALGAGALGLASLAEAAGYARDGRGLLAARAEGSALSLLGIAAQSVLVALAAGGIAAIIARLDRLIDRTPRP
jgi:hypothetical protein